MKKLNIIAQNSDKLSVVIINAEAIKEGFADVIYSGITEDQFNILGKRGGYRKVKTDKSVLGYYFLNDMGDELRPLSSQYKKGERVDLSDVLDRRIGAVKDKILKIETFDSPDSKPDIVYTKTDGAGNYVLSNDHSIWYTDKDGMSELQSEKTHGNPKKLYKGKPQLFIARFNGKLGIWDLSVLELVGRRAYHDIDDIVRDIYGKEDILGDDREYLEFNPKFREPDYDIW